MWVRIIARVRVTCGPACSCSIKIHDMCYIHVVKVRVSVKVTCG